MIMKTALGAVSLGGVGWLASQSFAGAIVLCVLLAAVLLLVLAVAWPKRSERPESVPAWSVRPVGQAGSGEAPTAVPAPSRAGIAGPRDLHLHFHGVSDDQAAEVVKSLPR